MINIRGVIKSDKVLSVAWETSLVSIPPPIRQKVGRYEDKVAPLEAWMEELLSEYELEGEVVLLPDAPLQLTGERGILETHIPLILVRGYGCEVRLAAVVTPEKGCRFDKARPVMSEEERVGARLRPTYHKGDKRVWRWSSGEWGGEFIDKIVINSFPSFTIAVLSAKRRGAEFLKAVDRFYSPKLAFDVRIDWQLEQGWGVTLSYGLVGDAESVRSVVVGDSAHLLPPQQLNDFFIGAEAAMVTHVLGR